MTRSTPSLPPPPPRAVLVHGLADARAAVAAAAGLGVPVALVAPAAGAGALWLLEVARLAAADHPGVAVTAVLDCGDRAGDALGAIAAGIGHVLFTGRADVAARLAGIARARGAVLLTAPPAILDPRGARDGAAACRAWLSGGG